MHCAPYQPPHLRALNKCELRVSTHSIVHFCTIMVGRSNVFNIQIRQNLIINGTYDFRKFHLSRGAVVKHMTELTRFESRDVTEMGEVLGGWDRRYQQLSPGSISSRVLTSSIGSLGIFHNYWQGNIQYEGATPKDVVAMAVNLVRTEGTRWLGQLVGADDLIVMNGDASGESISGHCWDTMIFMIPRTKLMQQIAYISSEDPEHILQNTSIIHLPATLAGRLRQACMAYLAAMNWSLAHPELSLPLPEMAESLVELLALAAVSTSEARNRSCTGKRHAHILSRAREYSAYHCDRPLRIWQLCREIGVSERTLRHIFQQRTGMSPHDFLKSERLNMAHRMLRDNNSRAQLIKQFSHSIGFPQVGHFSRDYKQLFGELPSHTLSKV
jgi:AraC family ethanolamine operon transcriptional activator